jgi:hypothetical protein
MLFDLRGRGRRRFIKVIYVTLAFLMGGGLVLFGIGGSVSGGLVDAITGSSSGGNSPDERARKNAKAAAARVKANPQDATAWNDLTRARIQLATSGDLYNANTDSYTDKGKEKLRLAVSSWDKYVSLQETQSDERSSLASRMVRVFVALNDFTQAARAQEIIAEDRGSVGAYSQLAVLSYQAGQTRKGDLESAKQQGLVNQVAPASGSSG